MTAKQCNTFASVQGTECYCLSALCAAVADNHNCAHGCKLYDAVYTLVHQRTLLS